MKMWRGAMYASGLAGLRAAESSGLMTSNMMPVRSSNV
jgi:hypothetical protein